MRAVEVIEDVARLVGDKDVLDVLLKPSDELTEKETKAIRRYLSGVNIAVDTIASRYYANLREVVVSSDNEAKVEYLALDERVCEIMSVKDAGGFEVDFFSLPFHLYLPKKNSKYLVKFKFLPRKVEKIDDELEILPFIPLSAISYLMASDIFLAKNLYDESRFWFSKFESVINQAVSSRRMRTLNFTRLI